MPAAAATDPIENKLVAARTRLILDKPFLGALVLRLPLQAANPSWCADIHSDAKTLYYNREYIGRLDLGQVQFVLSAQALHCALSHFNRRGHRDPARWNLACAHAVNLILVEEGLSAPADAPCNPAYSGMTAEEIFPLLDSETPAPEADGDAADTPSGERERDSQGRAAPQTGAPAAAGPRSAASVDALPGAAPPPPLREVEKDALQQQWQQRLAGAAQQAQQAGKLGAGMARLIDLFLQPTLPWRAVLASYMNSIARDDYSYARPSSRRGDPAIYPSLRGAQVDLVVAVDVSGSIDAAELNEFMTEIDALKAQVRARVVLLTCDAEITGGPWRFEAWECCALPRQVIGHGGTDFRPVFDWVETCHRRPDLLIYFTDAAGRFPEFEPDYATLWLVKGQHEVPWGQRIQLN